jgi:hypothetical protein
MSSCDVARRLRDRHELVSGVGGFECLDLGQAASVARSVAETGRQEGLDQFQGQGRSDHLAAQAKHVHVVVFDALMGRKDIVNEPGAHAGDLVRCDRGADAAATQRDAALDLLRCDGPGQG